MTNRPIIDDARAQCSKIPSLPSSRTAAGGGTPAGLLALALLPMLVLGKRSCVIVHNDRDSSLARFAVTAQPEVFLAGADVPVGNVINGQPRVCFPPALTLVSLLFYLFKPWTAYLLIEVLVRGFAFAGMLCLVRREIAPGSIGRPLGPWLALSFAVLPFYRLFGLSVTGMPLLACCLLNVARRRYRAGDFFFLAVYSFSSSLVLAGVFVLVTVLGSAAVVWTKTRRFPAPLVGAAGLLRITYSSDKDRSSCSLLAWACQEDRRLIWKRCRRDDWRPRACSVKA
jgi:hypothetical protein